MFLQNKLASFKNKFCFYKTKSIFPSWLLFASAAGILFLGMIFGGNGSIGVRISGLNFSFYRIFSLICLVLMIIDYKYVFSRIRHCKLSFFWILCFWILYSLIQLIYAVDRFICIKEILILGNTLVAFLFFLIYINSKQNLKTLILVASVSILFTQLFAFVEMFTGKNLFGETNGYGNPSLPFNLFIPISFFGNENDLGLYCLLTLPIFILGFISNIKKISKYFYLFCFLFNAFIGFGTTSRTFIFSFLIFIFCLLVFLIIPKKYNKIFNLSLFSIFILSIPLFFVCLYGMSNTRFNLIVDSFFILFRNSFGFGVGLGQFEYYMANYVNTDGVVNAHFLLAEIWTNSGLLVFSILFVFTFFKIISVNNSKYSFKNRNNLFMFVFCCLFCTFFVVWAISSVASSSAFRNDFMWVLLAFFAAIEINKKNFINQHKRRNCNNEIKIIE